MRPYLTLIAGPNGSGKTTLTQRLAETVDLGPVINPDDFILRHSDLPVAEAIRAGTEDAAAKRRAYLTAGQSFALETVFSSRDKTDFLAVVRDQGYALSVFFVTTDDPRINCFRVGERVLHGGHPVPIEKIIDRYYRTMLNLFEGVRVADALYAFDNSAADATPKPVFTTAAASLSEAQPEAAQPAWARDFLEQCQRFGWDLKAAKRDYAGRTRRIDGGRPDPEQDPGVPSS